MKKLAVVIYGPPGSGKGTQADLLVRKHGFIHFDTGRYIESLLRDPALRNDPVIKRERKLFDGGTLCTPSWVLKVVSERARRIARAGFSIVFSGSPRTWFEAFGSENHDRSNKSARKGLVETLGESYGKEHIRVIRLRVREESSLKRNSARVVCSICGLPVLAMAKNKTCSFCSGSPRKRTLDDPRVIRIRLKEYRERTYPILAELKRRGYFVREIDGEPLPYKVFSNIERALGV